MAEGKKTWKYALAQEVTALPICELCGESEEPIYKCKRCGTSFCECCGDVQEEICVNCLEEYTVEEEHEHIDYVKYVKPQEYWIVQKPRARRVTQVCYV